LVASTALIAGASLGLGAGAARAQSATWAGPGADWDTTTNWSPAGVPTATAIFAGATPTSITFSQAATSIGTMQFNAGAPAYTFTFDFANTFNVTGAGVSNNSSNAPTFTGTGVTSGTINFENSSTAGNANFDISQGLLSFQNNSNAGTATIANTVGGDARFPGTIEFHQSSSAANATISIIGTTGVPGAANGAYLAFFDTSTAGSANITIDQGICGAGVGPCGAGLAMFLNNSTAGNATIVTQNGGALQFGIDVDTSSAGNAHITNNNGGNTDFTAMTTAGNATIINNSGGTTSFFSQSTAGNANITNNAGGFVEFGFSGLYPFIIDTASAGNSTITNNGTVTFNSATTAGNAVITTNNGGNVFFFDVATGGAARFITNAGGTFDMSGLTSAGMTAGSIEGAGNYFLGAKQLTVGGNNLSTTVSGTISDGGTSGGIGGSLVKVGSGTLTLAGVNTYTGATTVDGGVLELNGTITSAVTVNSGAVFSGNGTVDPATVQINSGAVFAPGLPGQPGTFMTVNGSLAFQSGAIYLVQLNPSTTTYVMVNGAVTLAGTVDAFFAPGSYIVPKTYEILQSFDRTGTFSGVVTVPPNFQANLTYDPRNVFLNLTAILGLGGNLTVNQQNVATALNNFFNNGGTLPPNFSTVFGLTGPALANALNQIDGEASVDAEATAFKSMAQFLSLMLDPFVDGRTGLPAGGALGFAPDQPASFPPDIALAYDSVLKAPPKPAGFDQRWTAWGAAYGGSSNTNGDPAVIGSTSFTAQTYGFAAGMDRHISPDLVAGFALAGGGTHWDLAQAMGGGRSDAFQVGAYATKYFGPAYVAADIAFANHWMTTSRTAFAGDQLSANFNAQSYGGRIEAGYRYALPMTWSVTPYGALQVQNFHTPQYSETDLTGGGFGLTYNAMSAYDTRGELGARFDEPTTLYGMPLTLRARLAWAHDWVDGPALQAVFETLPGANFIVNGAAVAKNSALTTAGAELHLTQAWSLLTKFDGEFAKGSQTYAGTGTLRYVW
jgi:autotransporter-associated beta strand protein